jgi:DNA-binding MarR family transcriptional regulator
MGWYSSGMTGGDQLRALDRLSFLLARHGQVMNVRLRQALATSGLSTRHGGVLTRLACAGATSQQDLIDSLAVDPSALVTILNDLECDGLVERRRDPADRRRHIVDITSAGRRAACAVEKAIADVEQDAFAELDSEEITRLRMLLSRLRTRSTGDGC